jgi:selenocysteine-specific elongation factor
MVLTLPHLFHDTQVLDVRLDLLPTSRPLKSFSKVRFHLGTSEVLARVALLGQSALEPGKTAFAQLRLDAPVFCLHGDAFIIRQFSPTMTIGGGRVLNPHAVKHKVTDRQSLHLLQSLEKGDAQQRLQSLIALHPLQMMGLRELNAALGFPEAELSSLGAAAAAAGKLVMVPGPVPTAVLPAVIEALRKETLAIVSRFHRENPLLRGMSREELRKRAYDGVPPEVFRFCLDTLSEEKKLSLQEDMVAQHGREVQLSPAGLRIKEMIEELLRQAGWQPPAVPDIPNVLSADPVEVRKICSWMIKEKILVRIAEDMVYHRTTINEMKERIHSRYQAGARFGVSEFKELFDLTRKYAIPLLEYLDRERFTRRQGSERILL